MFALGVVVELVGVWILTGGQQTQTQAQVRRGAGAGGAGSRAV